MANSNSNSNSTQTGPSKRNQVTKPRSETLSERTLNRGSEQAAGRKPNNEENHTNSYANRDITLDDDPPKTSGIKGADTRDPDEPNRDLESRDSSARRFVRLTMNKVFTSGYCLEWCLDARAIVFMYYVWFRSFQPTSRGGYQFGGPDTCIEIFLVILSYMAIVMLFPFSLFCIFVSVRQFERVVIMRNGKLHKNHVFGPGLVLYLPCIDVVKYIDLRIICYAVPPQETLTKDSLTVSIDAVVYYKISDPISAVINVADYRSSTQFLAATMLRNALGTRNLAELLRDRHSISRQIFHNMKLVAGDWGITVVRVDVKEISLPIQLQKAMATEAESSRLANAKIIVAKAEIESTKNLQQATNILMDNPLCMQLRYLQSLQMISGDKTHTIIFPFSIEHLRKIFK